MLDAYHGVPSASTTGGERARRKAKTCKNSTVDHLKSSDRGFESVDRAGGIMLSMCMHKELKVMIMVDIDTNGS